MTAPLDAIHILRIEVTVGAAIQRVDDGSLVGRNLSDATVAFGWRTNAPPDDVSDTAVQRALAKGMTLALATITGTMVANGWVDMGQVEEPMVEHSHPTGEMGSTEEVRVRMVDSRATVHD